MRIPLLFCCIAATLLFLHTTAQDSLSLVDKIANFPNRVLERINKKASELDDKIIASTEKALRKLEKQEQKLKRKLAKTDSLAAENLFNPSLEKYKQLREGLNSKTEYLNNHKQYIPYFDTLKTSLDFLSKNDVLKNVPLKEVQGALSSVKNLDSRLQYAEQVRAFIQKRRQVLKEQLGSLGFVRELKKYNEEVYYYSEQIKEYQAILKDPEKIARKALDLITRLPAFQKFWSQYSEIAQLFPLPPGNGTPQVVAGLQTRSSVQALIQQQMLSTGTTNNDQFRQYIQQSQSQLSEVKNKMNQLGANSATDDFPEGFKPNTQKTKNFWKRIELGTTFQSQKTSRFFPATNDVGISAGYRINDKSLMGVGASYKFGMGKDYRHIRFSHEGVGIKSFVDWKIKGSFWLTGGYEMNYLNYFATLDQLKIAQDWQHSGLIGISKQVSLKTKFLKKTKFMVLFDFLSYRQVPQTEPIVFRMGYGL